MVKLQYFKKDECFVSFEQTMEIDREHGKKLEESLKKTINQLENLRIDLRAIEKISSKGYNYLSRVNDLAVKNNCKLTFTGVPDNLTEIVDSFTLTEEG